MDILLKEYPSLLIGGLVTIELAIGLLALGFFLGMVLAAFEVYGNKFFSRLATAIQKVIRGIPALVMLMLGFFGLTSIIDIPALWIAMLVLGIRSAAYQSQIFRGAIQSIDVGQMEAAKAIGMSKRKAIQYVIVPQILKLSIGPWTNEFSAQVKDTSLAYAIGVMEILRRGRAIIDYTYGHAMLIYCVVGIFYFIVTRTGNSILYRIERRITVPGFERRKAGS